VRELNNDASHQSLKSYEMAVLRHLYPVNSRLLALRVVRVGRLARTALAASRARPALATALSPDRSALEKNISTIIILYGSQQSNTYRATSVARRRSSSSTRRLRSGRTSRLRGRRTRATVSTTAASLRHSQIGRASAEVALDRHDLVVVGAELHAETGPGVEVVRERHGAGAALVAADGPELRESAGAFDGGGVVALVGVDIVGVAVGGDGAFFCGAGGRVEGAEVFDDVVFD
jgi:hypothetical protein